MRFGDHLIVATIAGVACLACERHAEVGAPASRAVPKVLPRVVERVAGRDYPVFAPVPPLMPEQALEVEVLRLPPNDRLIDHGYHVELLSEQRSFKSWLDEGDVEIVADAWQLRRDFAGVVHVMRHVPTTAAIPDGPHGSALLRVGERLAFLDWTLMLVAIRDGRHRSVARPHIHFRAAHGGRVASSWAYDPAGSEPRHDFSGDTTSRRLRVVVGNTSLVPDMRESTVVLTVHEVEVGS